MDPTCFLGAGIRIPAHFGFGTVIPVGSWATGTPAVDDGDTLCDAMVMGWMLVVLAMHAGWCMMMGWLDNSDDDGVQMMW